MPMADKQEGTSSKREGLIESSQSSDSDVDIINVSLREMELGETGSPDWKTSTPVKEKQTKKHSLTPSAKEREPASKRQAVSAGRSPEQTLHSTGTFEAKSADTMSAYQIKRRRCSLTALINENFAVEIGETCTVTQSDALQTLGLTADDKSRLTHAISKAFPDVETLRRRLSGNQREVVYINLKKKSFMPADDKQSIVFPENSGVENVKKAIGRLQDEQCTINCEIEKEMEKQEDNWNANYIKLLFERHKKIDKEIHKYTDGLVGMYEKEIAKYIERDQAHKLPESLKHNILDEMDNFKQLLNLGLNTTTEVEIDGLLFTNLSASLTEHCPLLFEIVEGLLLTSGDRNVQTGKRVHSASHALAILCSLSSQKLTNDFKILFTLLCISHGAEMRFVGMLNHIGLTVSWKKAMKVMDERMVKMKKRIKELTPTDIAIILLMDNINIYKGKRKHLRIFNEFTPSMWNFTGRAIIIPFLSNDVKKQMQNKKDMCENQKDVLKLKYSEILYSEKNEDDQVFEKYKDHYILTAMDKVYNGIGNPKKALCNMSEPEFNKWLSTSDFSKNKKKYKIQIPNVEDILDIKNCSRKTDTFVLPLSLEDNASISGTANILKEFETEFKLPSTAKGPEFLPYDTLSGSFDVDHARSRYEYVNSQAKHLNDMANFVENLHSKEMFLEGITVDDILNTDTEVNQAINELDGVDDIADSYTDISLLTNTNCTLENERKRFRKEDEKFWQLYNSLASQIQTAISWNNEEQFLQTVNCMAAQDLYIHRDHLGRSFLHVAIEKGNNQFAKALIFSGFNLNIKEGCGLTPLHLAIINTNHTMIEFLLQRNARFDGPMFSSIPSPRVIADKLHLTDAVALMTEKEYKSDEENSFVASIDRMLRSEQSEEDQHTHVDANGREALGSVTLVVGDVGTCKTNSAVMGRSHAFGWTGICIGDMHNKGYLNEACFKEHGQSGLHYIIYNILNRKKLTSEAFKRKKFQENFLLQIREANRDVCVGYCIAACIKFRESSSFPSSSDLAHSMQTYGNHSVIILAEFKKWLQKCCNEDVAFKHHSSTFCYYGPLMQLYDDCVRYGDGKAREVVFKLLLPVYAQLGFKNYFQESFRHVVNITAKWPKVTRSVLQDNCCVNLSGNRGKGIEMDAFVESEVVRPLKTYISGHTTVKMCQRIMGNIDLLKSCRAAYKSRESFDVHHTVHHSVKIPFPDLLKAGWFCLTKGFFISRGRKHVHAVPVDRKGTCDDKISSKVVNAYDKGVQIIKNNFKSKLYDCFPDLRYNILVDE